MDDELSHLLKYDELIEETRQVDRWTVGYVTYRPFWAAFEPEIERFTECRETDVRKPL